MEAVIDPTRHRGGGFLGGLLYALIGTACWFLSLIYGDLTMQGVFGGLVIGLGVLTFVGLALALVTSTRRVGLGLVAGALISSWVAYMIVGAAIASVTS